MELLIGIVSAVVGAVVGGIFGIVGTLIATRGARNISRDQALARPLELHRQQIAKWANRQIATNIYPNGDSPTSLELGAEATAFSHHYPAEYKDLMLYWQALQAQNFGDPIKTSPTATRAPSVVNNIPAIQYVATCEACRRFAGKQT